MRGFLCTIAAVLDVKKEIPDKANHQGSARSLHEVSHARRNGTQDLARVTTSF
jgi:hypothetical protein